MLRDRGLDPVIYHYLDAPPDAAALDAVLRKLDLRAAAAVARRGEKAWKDCGLTPDSPEEDVRGAMIAHPILIERPILETADAAVIGRPPTAVLDLV